MKLLTAPKLKINVLHYYLAILFLLAFQATNTVYKLGSTIGQSEQLTHLQQEKTQLTKELALLQEEQHTAKSLTTIAQESQVAYQPISSTITMTLHDTVASR